MQLCFEPSFYVLSVNPLIHAANFLPGVKLTLHIKSLVSAQHVEGSLAHEEETLQVV